MGLGGMMGGGGNGNPQDPQKVSFDPWFANPNSSGQPMADREGGSIPPMRGSFMMSDKHPWAGLPTYQEAYHPASAGITGNARRGVPTNGDEYGGIGGVTIGGGSALGGGPQVNQRNRGGVLNAVARGHKRRRKGRK